MRVVESRFRLRQSSRYAKEGERKEVSWKEVVQKEDASEEVHRSRLGFGGLGKAPSGSGRRRNEINGIGSAKGSEKTPGQSGPGYALCLNDLGAVYLKTREYAKAEAVLLKAKEARRRYLGEEHVHYAATLNYLAKLYQSTGDFAQAESLLMDVLRMQEKVFGKEHARYVMALDNLGGFYVCVARYAEGEKLLREAAEVEKKLPGKEHPHTTARMICLAKACFQQTKYAEAETLWKTAMEEAGKKSGMQNAACVECLNDLATLYQTKGDYAEAKRLRLSALDTAKESLGEEHPGYAKSLSGLATLHQAMGDYGKSETLLRQALNIFEKDPEKNHAGYARALNDLGRLRQQKGDYAQAESFHLKAREIRKKWLGEEHPEYAASLNNLGALYQSMGDYAKAEPLLLEAKAKRQETMGRAHPSYAQSLNNLGAFYFLTGNPAKAEPLYVEACEILRKTLGEEHPRLARSLNNLALVHQGLGDYAKAEPLLTRALDIRRKQLGEKHPEVAVSLQGLAMLYHHMEKHEKAESLFLEALKIRTEGLGFHHPETALTLGSLAMLYHDMGDHAKAEEFAQKTLDSSMQFAKTTFPHLPESRVMALRSKLVGPDLLLFVLRDAPNPDAKSAYRAVWETRGLFWRTAVARRRTGEESREAKSLRERLQETSTELAQLTLAATKPDQFETRRARLAELNGEKERLEAELARAGTAMPEGKEQTAATPDDLAALLEPDEAIVELIRAKVWIPDRKMPGKKVTKAHYDAFVLRRDEDAKLDVHWVRLGPAEPIDKAVTAWREAMVAESDSERAKANELRKIVWDKVDAHLAGCGRVTVVPDGTFHLISWAALPGRKPESCLLEDYALATAASTQRLCAAFRETQSPRVRPCWWAPSPTTPPPPVNRPRENFRVESVRRAKRTSAGNPSRKRRMRSTRSSATGREVPSRSSSGVKRPANRPFARRFRTVVTSTSPRTNSSQPPGSASWPGRTSAANGSSAT